MALEICAASSKKKNQKSKTKRLWMYLIMLFPEQNLWLNNTMNEKHIKTLPSPPPSPHYLLHSCFDFILFEVSLDYK